MTTATITRTGGWVAYSGTFADVITALDGAGVTKTQVAGVTMLTATTILVLVQKGF